MLRWLGLGLLGLLALLIVSGAAAYMLLGSFELGPFAGRRASAALGREVSIGSLHLTPGRWIVIEMHAARLANLPNGSRPVMAEVGSVIAEINTASLLHGPLLIRRLVVDGLDLLLERPAGKAGNWNFSPGAPASSSGATSRAQFPILLDAKYTGDVTYRLPGGAAFRTHIDDGRLQTDAADAPVHLTGRGQYNGVPVSLAADLASIAALRDAAKPYQTDLRLESAATTLRFQGTMTDPLNADGADGKLTLDAPTLEAIYRIAGISSQVNAPLRLAGAFTYADPHWHLSSGTGMVANDTISSIDLRLDEGTHGTPDQLGMTLAFDRLDLDALLGDRKRGGGHDADLSLAVKRVPDTLAEAKLSAKSLVYSGLSLANFVVAASLKPGRISVDTLSLDYLGATARASGSIESLSAGGNDSGRVTVEADMSNMEVQALRRLLALRAVPLQGRMEGRIEVVADGATLNQAAHDSHVSAVVAMRGGSISRAAVALASTNALALLLPTPGASPIACLLAAVDMRAGVGTISTLRIRAADGTIVGHGQFDLFRHRLDITVSTKPNTTSALALDVPVRVSGSFADPTVSPAAWSPAGRAELAAGDDVSRLLPNLQSYARLSPCLGAPGRHGR